MTSKRRTKPEVERQRLAKAEASVVPGFPEITALHPQCRLCALVGSDPELLTQIHMQAKSGAGSRRLQTAFEAAWADRLEQPMDHQNYKRHIENHCTIKQPIAAPSFDEPIPEAKIAEANASLEKMAEHDDYFELRDLILQLRQQMENMSRTKKNDSSESNFYWLTIWLKIVSELRACLESLSRMRNSDRVTKAVLQAHTKRFVQLFSEPLLIELQKTLVATQQGEGEPAVARLIDESVSRIIQTAATSALRETSEAYKLN